MRFRELKAKLACVLAVSMLFGTNTVQLMAAEPYEEAAFVETEAVMEDVADVEQAPEAVAAEEPAAAEPTAEEAVQEEVVTASAEEDAVGGEEINIEINQGFSLHEKKDMLKSDSLTYMSNFVAGKATAVMFSVAADTEEAAKERLRTGSCTTSRLTKMVMRATLRLPGISWLMKLSLKNTMMKTQTQSVETSWWLHPLRPVLQRENIPSILMTQMERI